MTSGIDLITCIGCTLPKPRTDFYDRALNKRFRKCKVCMTEDNRKRYLDGGRQKKQNLRLEVLLKYGGKCRCCGEGNPRFLTLDHVNNDGAQHRREIRTSNLYEWASENNFPDTLQVLCSNCNNGKHWGGGTCPHEKSVDPDYISFRILARIFRNKVTITEPEFEKAVGLSHGTIWRLRREGVLKPFRDGRRILYGPQHFTELFQHLEQQI